MECLIVGLGKFGRSIAKNLKQNDVTVVGIDHEAGVLEEAESFLDESINLDASIETNLRNIGVEHFHHCFVCIGDNMEYSLTIVFNLLNLGASKITVRSISNTHSLLLQKIGSVNIIFPEDAIAQQLVKEVLTDIENYVTLKNDMVVLTIPVPEYMVNKTLRDLSLMRKYRIQILWMDKFVPYVDGAGHEEVYQENVSFIPTDYCFNTFDRISIFGSMSDIQVFTKSMESLASAGTNVVHERNEIE